MSGLLPVAAGVVRRERRRGGVSRTVRMIRRSDSRFPDPAIGADVPVSSAIPSAVSPRASSHAPDSDRIVQARLVAQHPTLEAIRQSAQEAVSFQGFSPHRVAFDAFIVLDVIADFGLREPDQLLFGGIRFRRKRNVGSGLRNETRFRRQRFGESLGYRPGRRDLHRGLRHAHQPLDRHQRRREQHHQVNPRGNEPPRRVRPPAVAFGPDLDHRVVGRFQRQVHKQVLPAAQTGGREVPSQGACQFTSADWRDLCRVCPWGWGNPTHI